MTVDPSGRTVLSNAAADDLLHTVLGVQGTDYAVLDGLADQTTDPEGARAAMMALATDHDRVATDEFELRASGRVFRNYSAPVRADDGALHGRLFITDDVTEERRAGRAKDEFVQLASHELRTPLTSILGYLEVLQEGDAGDLSPDQRRFIDVVARNARRLLRLVGDLLVVARADAGRLALQMDDVDLGQIAAECADSAMPSAAERGVVLEAETASLPVHGDRGRLAEVVDNLLSNALKFTPPGGSVRVVARSDAGQAVLSVDDSGIGIPAADQAHVFERFFRTEAALAAAVPGTGLRLAISKAIVEAHGGAIDVESEEGRGATFTVRLALLPGAVARRDAPTSSPLTELALR